MLTNLSLGRLWYAKGRVDRGWASYAKGRLVWHYVGRDGGSSDQKVTPDQPLSMQTSMSGASSLQLAPFVHAQSDVHKCFQTDCTSDSAVFMLKIQQKMAKISHQLYSLKCFFTLPPPFAQL